MNIKIKIHYMPWEVDYALLQFMQLKKASKYLSPDDNVYFYIGLNLSEYIIDWNKSKLPKEHFINKFKALLPMLDWAKDIQTIIYEGSELWGHLDMEKTQMESYIDYYMSICPDMWFHEHTLFYIIESAKKINNEYFIITPQIHKLWDWTWDELVNDAYKNVPYNQWNKSDIFQIQSVVDSLDDVKLKQMNRFKWAGWFDLYSKKYVEEFAIIPSEWKGYGPWDFYGMQISEIARSKGIDIAEYVLENQIIFEYHPDKENKNNFADYYKDLLHLNKIENQRKTIESKFPYYIQQWVEYAKHKLKI
jgi:hypothetical protein